jgi:hypothetical protein
MEMFMANVIKHHRLGTMTENNEYKVLSILSSEEIKKMDELPKKAICGYFTKDDLSPENFVPNQEFIDCLHKTIRFQGYKLESMKLAAKRQGNGYIYIIDFRTNEGIMGNVPPEDIIGGFKVRNGRIIFEDYAPNHNYKVYTNNGLIKLPTELKEKLIEELKK